MQNEKNEEVANERRRVFRVSGIIAVVGVIGLFVAASLLSLPWYVAAIGSVVWVFGMVVVEAEEEEDEVLVKAYGPTKKEPFVSGSVDE